MRTTPEGARASTPPTEFVSERRDSAALVDRIVHWLDDAKAEDVAVVDLKGKTSIGDFMVIATGRSDRHVNAVAEQILQSLKDEGLERVRVEGQPQCDWVLIDTGDIIVHVFQPEIRAFYHMRDPETGLTKSYDLLYKGVEITTGAQREHRVEVLEEQAREKGLDPEHLAFYFDFFRYGVPPHGGFGMGLARVLMLLLGQDSIREVTYLFRGPTRLAP